MDDLGIEATAAQELVKLLVSGVGEAAKKVPRLWQRSGEAKERVMAEELEHSATALSQAQDLQQEQANQQGVWAGHLRVLLAEHPEAKTELDAMVADLRSATTSAGSSNVDIRGNIQAKDGGIAIGGVAGGNVSFTGDHRDPR